jgi:DNA-binding GntR family transcriptional regulator
MSKSEYLKLADAIAAEIADGTLKPGDRLCPASAPVRQIW